MAEFGGGGSFDLGAGDLDAEIERPAPENNAEALDAKTIKHADALSENLDLSDVQRTFIREYLVNLSLTRTARMLNIPIERVKVWVKQKQFQVALYSVVVRRHQQTEELTEFTIDNLKGLVQSDISNFVEWENVTVTVNGVTTTSTRISLVPLEELKKKGIDTRAIKFIKQTRFGTEIGLHDKPQAIQLMMQGLGLLKKPMLQQDPEIDEVTEKGLLEALQEAQEKRQKEAEEHWQKAIAAPHVPVKEVDFKVVKL